MQDMPLSRVVPIHSLFQCILSRIDAFTDWFLRLAWPSYAIVSALQVKVLWGIWKYRDLTSGDTSSYFNSAVLWHDKLGVNIVWSPLYTAFYGSTLFLSADAHTATILHRVIIVLIVTICVLALMRKLLAPGLALVIAAWWTVLPINFNTLYEVHLFSVLPILAAWLTIASRDTSERRGVALAILFASSFLVRNELILAFLLFATACIISENYESHLSASFNQTGRRWLLAYGLPLAAATALCLGFYALSVVKYPKILLEADIKHTLNMCQVYAFGYQQRHPGWSFSPWTECGSLMEATFGTALPTLSQMIRANPSAALEHFLWNLSLTPNGLQVSLFNAMFGTINPDYAPVESNVGALVGSIAVLGLVGIAFGRLLRDREFWLDWFRDRRGLLLIMAAVVCVSIPVIITQRPRPSYLFSLTLALMVVVGLSVNVLMRSRLCQVNRVGVVGILFLLIIVPPYYALFKSDRPLFTTYRRLQPFVGDIKRAKGKVYFGEFDYELRSYLRLEKPADGVSNPLGTWDRKQFLHEFLAAQGIDVFFVQPHLLTQLMGLSAASPLLEHPETVGWEVRAPRSGEESPWRLLVRRAA